EELLPRVAELQEAFAREVKALYSADDRMIGYICGRDREGNERRFDLLGCTVAAVVIPAGVEIHDTEQLANALASAKS
ncbi:hypothetical protein, partial [Streptomyces acidiscabies]|uniref:hypothetical protein n=1 Tax=Streptomyces acidiscabies TaxID=42234 RepID=UPI0038F8010E